MTSKVERPLSLIPSINLIVGNEHSQKLITAAYDEAFAQYKQTYNAGWSDNDSMRNAYCTLIGSLESKIHDLAERVEG
jgi:hypothetical protein